MSTHDHINELGVPKGGFDDKTWAAINYAASAHEGQRRKHTDEWYITHPLRVLEYVKTVTEDSDTLCAAVLHDTIESTDVVYEDIEHRFGENVSLIVRGVTKDYSITDWRERNEAYLKHLEFEAPDQSIVIALADKITNVEDQIKEFASMGNTMWEKFNAGPHDQLWWYTSVLELGKRRLPDNPLVGTLEERLVDYIQQVIDNV